MFEYEKENKLSQYQWDYARVRKSKREECHNIRAIVTMFENEK
jgi:hypothetical protein